jgi:hypothetical protein
MEVKRWRGLSVENEELDGCPTVAALHGRDIGVGAID